MSTPNIYTAPNYADPVQVLQFSPVAFTNTTATFSVGSATATTNPWVIDYPGTLQNLPGEIVIDTTVIGANGCSPVSIVAPSAGLQIFPVYAIDRTSGTTDGSLNGQISPALIIATSSTNFVPVGYDVFKQVGFVLVNSSGNLVPYSMTGLFNERYITLQDAAQFLNAGVATTQTTVDVILGLTAQKIAPGAISQLNIQYRYTPTAATSILSLVPTGLTPQTATFPIEVKASGAAQIIGQVVMNPGIDVSTPSAPVIAVDYKTTSASDSVSLYVSGFTYTIPFAY